jgi:serine/threonine protein kinase
MVNDEGPLAVPRAARLFGEVAAALEHAHCRGVIHRDLKPSNIMVTTNDHAKVLDLGLAIIEGEIHDDHTVVGGQGYVVGTMDYIAPEQSEDAAKVDARSDVYGLGCTLYFALAGQPPFPGGSAKQKIMRHRNELPVPLPELNPTVPPEFVAVLRKMMAKRPQERFESADEVRRELLRWAGTEPPLPVETAANLVDQSFVIRQAEDVNPDLMAEAIPVASADTPPPRRRAVALPLMGLPAVPPEFQSANRSSYLVPIAIGGLLGLAIASLFLLLIR